MRLRWVGRARVRARLAAGLLSVVFATLAVSACTGSGTPNAGASASSTFFTAKAPGSGTATATTVPTTTLTPTEVPIGSSASPSPSPSPSPQESTLAPIGAPSTGGGGTAGLQHVMLFGLGGLAVLAGLGSLIYRRRSLGR
jgi:hypothetical protein